MQRAFGVDLPLVAEDLGVITAPVRRLRDELRLPGMVITEFGFEPGDEASPHRFARHVERSVAYTSTHDNSPLGGWWESAGNGQRGEAERTLADVGIAGDDPVWALIELTLRSAAQVAIVQAQDVLGLGDEARMNTPGIEGGNWSWRLEDGQLGRQEAERLRAISESTARHA
jgi:4-alpha-glucanotransferase